MVFYLTLVSTYNLTYTLVFFMASTFAMLFIASKLIQHPLLQLLEGEGVLALTIDSTGIIQPFICKVEPPYVKGKVRGQEVTDIWDRETVFYLTNPKKGMLTDARDEKGEIYKVIVLGRADEKNVNETFAFNGYPTLIYNKMLNTFLTKQALATLEASSIVKHTIFHLNKRVEELTAMIRDFARYVVEQTKPKRGFFGIGNWFWIILVIIIGIVIILLLPAFIESLGGPAPVSPVQQSQPVIPR